MATFHSRGFRHKGEGSFIGEMVNESGQSYKLATFKLSIYDSDAELIDTGAVVITNFGDGQSRSFEAYIEDAPGRFFYKMDFENGL